MRSIQLLGFSLVLSAAGAALIWWGALHQEFLVWIGLAAFTASMVIGPLTRFVGGQQDETPRSDAARDERSDGSV